MPKADPLMSAGARLERKALKEYLERQIKKFQNDRVNDPEYHLWRPEAVLGIVYSWVMGRQNRYSKKPGGLGK